MLDTNGLRKILETPKELKGIIGEKADWDSFFLATCYLVSTRSSCSDRQVGAILVKEKTIIATGYNGAPRGIKDCYELGYCIREDRDKSKGKDYDNCFAAHAEVNALANCAYMGGTSTAGTTLYTVVYPCTGCARLLINAGVKRIIYCEGIKNDTGLTPKLFKEAEVQTIQIPKEKVAATLYKALDHLVLRDEFGA